LHRITSALPPNAHPWLLVEKLTVVWNPEARAWLDVAEFQRAASDERQLESAIALYRGEFLEGFYDEWVLAERERLRQLYVGSLSRVIDARVRSFDYQGAIQMLQWLLQCDPWHEDAARQLMSLRFETGDRSGALSEFEAFTKKLRAELDTDPMPETRAVYEAIRRNEPLARWSVAGEAERPNGKAALPFVGRDQPLATARRAWERAATGSGRTLIVSGEAGIGKSRLIHELLVSAESQGARIAFGTTAAIESEPYQPVVEALRSVLPLIAVDKIEPVAAAALSKLVPQLRERAPELEDSAELPADRDRGRRFDAIGRSSVRGARTDAARNSRPGGSAVDESVDD